jgi:hypothetical protein
MDHIALCRRVSTAATRVLISASALLATMPTVAHAQEQGAPTQPAEDPAAKTLFDEGAAAVDRGDYAVGCTKFEQSLALVRRASTLLNLALCAEHDGKLKNALALYDEGIDRLDPQDPRLAQAKQARATLAPRLPELTVMLDAKLSRDAKVRLDGGLLETTALGRNAPVDPGSHEVVLSLPGQPDQRVAFSLTEGERRTIDLKGPKPAEAATAARAAESAAPAADAGEPVPLATIGYVVGGVGLATLAVGAITGILTIGKKSTMEDNCTPSCNAEARDAANAGKTLSAVSTATFIAGGAALVAGAVLVGVGLANAQPDESAGLLVPVVGPGSAGLVWAARF